MGRHTFIVGVPRSGTSAMVRLLNTHPRVCIGLERYRGGLVRAIRAGNADALFTYERFFDWTNDTGVVTPDDRPALKSFYDKMRGKWHTAEIVGEKFPRLFNHLELLWSQWPRAKVVFMLRDIHRVASSYNVRAANPEDQWPADSDYRHAVMEWNKANIVIRDLLPEYHDRICIVPYERFYSGDGSELRRLCNFLGIEVAAPLRQDFDERSKYYREAVATKSPLTYDGQKEHLEREIDRRAARVIWNAASV